MMVDCGASMGYVGCATIDAMRERAEFVKSPRPASASRTSMSSDYQGSAELSH